MLIEVLINSFTECLNRRLLRSCRAFNNEASQYQGVEITCLIGLKEKLSFGVPLIVGYPCTIEHVSINTSEDESPASSVAVVYGYAQKTVLSFHPSCSSINV
jgi:hypothetical protein